jgi:osmotically-inducible protein OsmY
LTKIKFTLSLLLFLGNQPQPRKSKMPSQRTDSDIKNDILNELKWSPEVKETDIGVIAKDGAVTLAGFVPNYPSKAAAHRIAKRIFGVRSIVDGIEVKLPF